MSKNIDITRPVKTRDGRQVTLLPVLIDADPDYPLRGAIHDFRTVSESWTLAGSYRRDGRDGHNDLSQVEEEPKAATPTPTRKPDSRALRSTSKRDMGFLQRPPKKSMLRRINRKLVGWLLTQLGQYPSVTLMGGSKIIAENLHLRNCRLEVVEPKGLSFGNGGTTVRITGNVVTING